MTALIPWQTFYVIVGSSAGALTGLVFVAMALIADLPLIRGGADANDAFSTPIVVHFGVVLVLAAIMSAPWTSLGAPALLCEACGVAGLVYAIVVTRRMRKQSAYRPEFEDWLFHTILPIVSYALLGASGLASRAYPTNALFGVAAAALLLLVVGIHNVWDSVTYLVFVRREQEHGTPRKN